LSSGGSWSSGQHTPWSGNQLSNSGSWSNNQQKPSSTDGVARIQPYKRPEWQSASSSTTDGTARIQPYKRPSWHDPSTDDTWNSDNGQHNNFGIQYDNDEPFASQSFKKKDKKKKKHQSFSQEAEWE
jgi:hypothetical protein